MDLSRILREGFVAGVIGATALALWFLIIDVIADQPFFTPAMLGSALFWGGRDPQSVEIAFSTVVAYTMIHLVAFFLVGWIAAAFASMVETFPSTLFLAVVFFAIFEFGFYLVVAVLARPLLGALAWWSVAIGNLIAAAGMGYYLWRAHPGVRASLAARPLGETADGE